MKATDFHRDTSKAKATSTGEAEPENAAAWEQIETGRYRPRRIRGSFRGRELG